MISHAMTRTVLTGLAATALAITTIAGTAGVASAADTDPLSTEMTFSLAAGNLAISVATQAETFPGAVPGTSVSKQFSASVTVTDNRGAYLGSWRATATASDFITGDQSSAQLTDRTVGRAAVSYSAGDPLTVVGGVLQGATGVGAVFVPGAGGSMAQAVTAYSAESTLGNNSVSWKPTITVDVPAQALAGTYTGTITHSVT